MAENGQRVKTCLWFDTRAEEAAIFYTSLFGDSHVYGPEGINFYTRGKVVTSRWPDPHTSKVDLGFPQTR